MLGTRLSRSFWPSLASLSRARRRHQPQHSRPQSTSTPPSTEQRVNNPSSFIHDQFAQSAWFVIDVYKRGLKYSLLGICALGITGWTAFEATHMWVENVELARELDDDVRLWEWDRDAEKWSGGERGGTDPALGFKGRHAARGAWIAENWMDGSGATVITPDAASGRAQLGLGQSDAIEKRLQLALIHITAALQVAENTLASGKLRPQTVDELLARHATILEHIGTKDALFEARSQYERLWPSRVGKEPDAAHLALKLGDLNFRLGDHEDALAWWTRAIGITQGSQHQSSTISHSVPSSPSAQRTLASTLVSLSAYYSTTGQLKQAQQVQESALALLRSIPSPPTIAAASPPQMLHSLYILHRSSLISIHLAEVFYALRSPRNFPVEYLKRAAESSERVAFTLCRPSVVNEGALGLNAARPPPSEACLVPVLIKSRSMHKPAKSLLRDARRAAAEAWNLLGILSEGKKDGDMERALQCYERALGWAGATDNAAGAAKQAGEGILEAEWKILWANYVRAREAVRAQEKQSDAK
ncbi:hypothetical protein F5I97DRAFT_572154 [Phlebopus sp. FC_14]|nr:hypothetical protein F5I97DRAFT_572154 [Phlebopus sp. FC_14]